MSDPIRIALVSEGPTDRVVVECALRAMLATRPFVLVQLQPEGSLAFGGLGGGWRGVYQWCKQSARRGAGQLSMDRLLQFALVIIHLDADVAGMQYGDANIVPDASDLALPCEQPCPPAADTSNALRRVVCSWCGAASIPDQAILCVPSKSTEAWVVAMLFPTDSAVNGQTDFECFADPATRLGQQRKRERLRKSQRDYQDRSAQLEVEWERISGATGLSEARRFRADIVEKVLNASSA